jgi:hypothetical protein
MIRQAVGSVSAAGKIHAGSESAAASGGLPCSHSQAEAIPDSNDSVLCPFLLLGLAKCKQAAAIQVGRRPPPMLTVVKSLVHRENSRRVPDTVTPPLHIVAEV